MAQANAGTEDKRAFITPAGAAIAAICFFLPWVEFSCDGRTRNTASGADMAHSDGFFWIIFAATLVILAAFFFFRTQKQISKARPIVILSAVVSLGILVFKYVQFSNGVQIFGRTFTPDELGLSMRFGGIGTFAGFVLVLIGAAFLTSQPFANQSFASSAFLNDKQLPLVSTTPKTKQGILFQLALRLFQLVSITFFITFGLGSLLLGARGVPYHVFVFAGLLPWLFFSNAVITVSDGSMATVSESPRSLMEAPLSALRAGLFDLAVGVGILICLMIYYRVTGSGATIGVTWFVFLLPVFVALAGILALSTAILLEHLSRKYSQLKYPLLLVIHMSIFLSPVIGSLSAIPHGWRWLFSLNPMTGIVLGFHAAFLGVNSSAFDWTTFCTSAGMILAVAVCALYVVRRTRNMRNGA